MNKVIRYEKARQDKRDQTRLKSRKQKEKENSQGLQVGDEIRIPHKRLTI
jgi:hypothetical protein